MNSSMHDILKNGQAYFENPAIWTFVYFSTLFMKVLSISQVAFNPFIPMHPFSTPWKHQKTFSDVFKG